MKRVKAIKDVLCTKYLKDDVFWVYDIDEIRNMVTEQEFYENDYAMYTGDGYLGFVMNEQENCYVYVGSEEAELDN